MHPPSKRYNSNQNPSQQSSQQQSKPRKRNPVTDDFDGAWKNMLTEQRFAAFTAFFLPDIYALIDWTRTPIFLEQELRAITRKTKRGSGSVDRLVKVWLHDGTEQWMLIHLEIQSQEDAGMPLRMFRYYFRARDLFDLRPIFSLAILADDNPRWKPDRHEEGIWGTGVHFTYRMVKLTDYESRLEELETSSNPFARFVLAHLKTLQTKGNYETRLEWKLRIIKGLYDMGVSENEIGQLYHDFDWLLTLPERLSVRYHQEMVRFEEERTMPHLSTAERIGRKEGRKEGRIEGRIEEAQEAILELLEVRFGTVAPDLTEQIHAILSLPRLRKLRRMLFEGMALADLEEAVRNVKV